MKELYPWQHEIWQRLQGLRARLPNALLLKGAEGIGKLDLAMDFAQSILCATPLPTGLACQNCPSCHWFAQESNPDFRLIQPDAFSTSEDAPDKDVVKKPHVKYPWIRLGHYQLSPTSQLTAVATVWY